MRTRHLTAVALTALIAIVPGTPGAAHARTTHDNAIYGDLNGDGRTDRVQLGWVAPDQCTVEVEFGRAQRPRHRGLQR